MRNYHVKPSNTLMRPDKARAKLLLSLVHSAQIVVVLLALLALYGWMSARDATAEAEDKELKTSALLASYMTNGAVQDRTTIYTCAARAYELPKGEL